MKKAYTELRAGEGYVSEPLRAEMSEHGEPVQETVPEMLSTVPTNLYPASNVLD